MNTIIEIEDVIGDLITTGKRPRCEKCNSSRNRVVERVISTPKMDVDGTIAFDVSFDMLCEMCYYKVCTINEIKKKALRNSYYENSTR